MTIVNDSSLIIITLISTAVTMFIVRAVQFFRNDREKMIDAYERRLEKTEHLIREHNEMVSSTQMLESLGMTPDTLKSKDLTFTVTTSGGEARDLEYGELCLDKSSGCVTLGVGEGESALVYAPGNLCTSVYLYGRPEEEKKPFTCKHCGAVGQVGTCKYCGSGED